jgi:excisionase family DNA binding protein
MTAMLSTEEAATYLGVHPRTLRRSVAEGILRAYRLKGRGRMLRFRAADLDGLLQEVPSAGRGR